MDRLRKATVEDIPEMVKAGELFFNETAYSEITTYNPESIIEVLEQMIEAGYPLIVAYKDSELIGLAGALVFHPFMNTHDLIAQELFWWVHPDHRGIGIQLLNKMEELSSDKGASCLIMLSLEAINPQRVGKIYEKRGYKLTEHSYMRVL